jgi:hypothetical protein
MNDIARPENPQPIPGGNIYQACHDFVLTYGLSDGHSSPLGSENVILGWHNKEALPVDADEYAVISIISDKQRGTAVYETDQDTEILSVKGLIEVAVQVDFCSENDNARQRARRLAIVTRSNIGVQFFKDYGMSVLFADDATDVSFANGEQQPVRQWATTLHLTLVEGISVEIPYFNQARVRRLENVDVHHKP